MKNLTTAGDITYFNIRNVIYGIDGNDGSAVTCHDHESPAERIDHMAFADVLDLDDVDYTDDYDAETRTWHGEGFDLVQNNLSFKIIKH